MLNTVIEELTDFKDELFSNKKKLGKIALIAIILMVAVIVRLSGSGENVTIEETSKESENTTVTEMYVDICGAVNKPGVYKVDSGTRLYQVIDQAGGLTDDADAENINRAEFVEDGQKITIPVLQNEEETTADARNDSGGAPASDNGLININTATADQLKEITGIGDVIAERIIEYRTSNKFKKIEDIMNVKGIGSATFEKMKAEITC